MGTRDKQRRRNRRRRLRAAVQFLFVTGSFSILAVFTVYSIKTWEKNEWEQAVSDSEYYGEEQLPGDAKKTSYESGGYGMDKETGFSKKEDSGKLGNRMDSAAREAFLKDRPAKRTETEVLARLEEMKKSYPEIETILKEKEEYPEDMLAALANNPEMIDFVTGYKMKSVETQAGGEKRRNVLTKEEKNQEFPLFLQWDERWGYAFYGDDSNIGLAGCGPTCLSMVLYYKTGNANRTPDVLGDYAMRQGYYVSGTGTAWAFMDEGARQYGLRVKKPSKSEETLKAELDRGRCIICAMGPGDFTAAGHFIVIYGYDEEGFFVNDPNSRTRSEKKWSFEEISGQIKSLWAYY